MCRHVHTQMHTRRAHTLTHTEFERKNRRAQRGAAEVEKKDHNHSPDTYTRTGEVAGGHTCRMPHCKNACFCVNMTGVRPPCHRCFFCSSLEWAFPFSFICTQRLNGNLYLTFARAVH